ncbi:MAG: hypothetical protein C0501_09835 [Isosphaera sp.]|nr:hypothetical protein [Isosphaera sp.]
MRVYVEDRPVPDPRGAGGSVRRKVAVEATEEEAGWGPLRGGLREEAERLARERAAATPAPPGFVEAGVTVEADTDRPKLKLLVLCVEEIPSYFPRATR